MRTSQRETVRERIRRWYIGEAVSPPEIRETDDGGIVAFTATIYRRHWTAIAAERVVEFHRAHWKWWIGIAVAVVLAFLA